MIRAISSVVLAFALSACGACVGPSASAPTVPEHTHRRAEIGLSCDETCSPGTCASAFGIAEQDEVPCDAEAKRYAYCVCQAPKHVE